MATARLDRRLNAYRPDLAEARLKGQVEAARFVEGQRKRVVASCAPLRVSPEMDAPIDTELLRGETVIVFEETAEGRAWIRSERDSYVGYVPSGVLAIATPVPTHMVAALRTFIYPGPDMKLPARGWLSLGSQVALAGEIETRGTWFHRLAGGEGAVVSSHMAPLDDPPLPDYVATAQRFENTPYLWGGRTSLGLDCSALVQLSLMRSGKLAPRDTDMQEATLGKPVSGGVEGGLQRGDLVFWKRHVGIMVDPDWIIHASGYQMSVVTEPLRAVLARLAKSAGPPTSVRRL